MRPLGRASHRYGWAPCSGFWRGVKLGRMMTKKPDRERLRGRWRDAQELSGGPFRLSGINRHIQFSALHAVAKARVTGDLESARAALDRSKAARTNQWINRLCPMELIERRHLSPKGKSG